MDEAGDYEADDDEAGHVVADRDTGEVRMVRMVGTKPEDLSHDTWQYMVHLKLSIWLTILRFVSCAVSSTVLKVKWGF